MSGRDGTTMWGPKFRPRHAAAADFELPRELAEEVSRASTRSDELRDAGHRLHFEVVAGRIRIELRDLDDHVVRRVSPVEALAVVAGAAP
jgi:hypothetical protein